MKKNIIIITAIAAVFGVSSMASAAETISFKNSAGITPDNVILYPLDKALERAKVYFTSGEENKAEAISKIAEERLGESEVMTAKGKAKLAETTLNEYNDKMSEAVDKIKDVVESETETDGTIADRIKAIQEKIADRQAKSLEVLNKIGDSASENAKTTLKLVVQMQTSKKEAMVNILKEKQVLMDTKQTLNDAKIALEKVSVSGDADAIAKADAVLAASKTAYDTEKANYKEVFIQEKANAKISVGSLKKEINSNKHEAVNKTISEENNGTDNGNKTESQKSKDNSKK